MGDNQTHTNQTGRRHAKRLLLLLLMTTLVAVSLHAQTEILKKQISLSNGYAGPSDTLINRVSRLTGITISYSNKVYANQSLNITEHSLTLQDVLDKIFSRFPVEYLIRNNKVIVAPQKSRYYTISGYCKDALNSEVLIGANVYDTLLYIGQATNDYGFFSITLPEGHLGIRASFVGYKTSNIDVYLRCDTMMTIRLHPSILIKDINVVADESDLNRAKTSTVELPMEQIKGMPSLLGESDVIKALEWTPGVNGGEEGFGGMSVRGGNSDQNVVMLDDVPLYSPNHLAGLYSVFNSESVNNATLIKGGFPARYGGRLSSVLDVKMKEGNMQKFAGYVNIGLLASNATLEGPIIKDKMSFIVSARRTYFDIFSSQIQRNSDQKYAFNFYDIHAKLNYIITPKDRLYVGFFTGYDNLSYGYNYRDIKIEYTDNDERLISINDSQKVKWGNIVASARWNHVYGSTLFSNTSAAFSRYRFRNTLTNYSDNDEMEFTNGYFSGINDASARMDFNWYTPFAPGAIRFGANITYHGFYPGVSVYATLTDENDSTLIETGKKNDKSIYRFETHVYAEDEMMLGAISINAGLHLSSLKRPNQKPYVRLEPRLLIGYEVNRRLQLKVGYSDMTQFMQLLRMVSVASPADIWMPASTKMAIPHAWQISGEVSMNIGRQIYFSTEAYYKKYINQQTYKSSLLIESLMGDDWDNIYSSGNGYSRGLEFFIHRKSGRVTGWIGYSLSQSRSRFDGINGGKEIKADNDRTHSTSAYMSYKLNDIVDLNATWQYTTGSPTTISDARFTVLGENESYTYPIEGERNAYRMPNSHTLNIGANIKRNSGKTERKLSFGIYNVYAHKNPMFVYWKQESPTHDGHPGTYKLKQFNLIAWPWPYLKYSIRF